MNVDVEFVRSVFDYDGENLIWKVQRRGRGKIGTVAGCINDQGYRVIQILGERHKAHRLVWLWHHGTWPEPEADHLGA